MRAVSDAGTVAVANFLQAPARSTAGRAPAIEGFVPPAQRSKAIAFAGAGRRPAPGDPARLRAERRRPQSRVPGEPLQLGAVRARPGEIGIPGARLRLATARLPPDRGASRAGRARRDARAARPRRHACRPRRRLGGRHGGYDRRRARAAGEARRRRRALRAASVRLDGRRSRRATRDRSRSFFGVGQRDSAFVEEVRELYAASAGKPKQLVVAPSSGHGTELLYPSWGLRRSRRN